MSIYARGAQSERGQLHAKRHATPVLQGNIPRTAYHARTVWQENTRKVTPANANHAAKERFPKQNRRRVPSVNLGNTPIAKTIFVNFARKAHILKDLWTNARSARKAHILGLARRNATSAVQVKNLTRHFCRVWIAVRPSIPPFPELHASNAQPTYIPSARKSSVVVAQVAPP